MIASPIQAAIRSLLGLCVAAAGVAAPVVRAAEPAVGQVSLLIGEARVVRKNGNVEALRRGDSIQVGDRIETAANGQVHLRFIDNGAISVRPESALEVQAYRYDVAQPRNNEVRLHVERGTSRSISGQATELDKNRFRLNTPIAAIGVRGTDFIVQSSDSGMRATVVEGAIVVGALGASCSAAALGPCAGGASVLSADMGRLMVEVQRGDSTARLVPVAGQVMVAATSAADERVAAQRAADAAARSAGMAAAQVFQNNDRTAADLLTIAGTALPELNSPSDPKSQLAWGRYAFSAPLNDNVSQLAVIAGRGRVAAVGDADSTLFRAADPSNPSSDLLVSQGSANFRLNRAQATFQPEGGRAEAASVDGGTLTLDFARRTFATALALSSDSAGKAELRVGGDVRSDGVFVVRDADPRQYVAGAVTADGKEAGYLFERGTVGGLFRGKTLWGR
jgi:hypothetical protein